MKATSQVVRWMKRFGHAPDITLDQVRRGRMRQFVEDQLVDTVIVPDPKKRFCACPDFVDQEIVQSSPREVADSLHISQSEATEVIAVHKSMLPVPERFDEPIFGTGKFQNVAGTGSGSFPRGCHSVTPRHSFTWHTNHAQWARYPHWVRKCTDAELQGIVTAGVWGLTRDLVDRYWAEKPMYRVAIELTMLAYLRKSIYPIEVPHTQRAMCRITCIPIPGSTIGLGWFNNGTCTGSFEARHDANWRPSLHHATFVICHEVGHVNRAPHTFGNQNAHFGIMSYRPRHPFQGFREGRSGHRVTGDWQTTIIEDPTNALFRRFYGDVPFVQDWLVAV